LQFLYNPPGVGSSAAIAIPENQTEALIPVTANNGAEVGKWKIVVLGDATVGDGPITVASQMATLEVAEPYIAFEFLAATTEKGKPTEIVCKMTKAKDFDGVAKVQMLGLPNEVTTDVKEITKDTTELVFNVNTTANSPVGKHATVICLATIMANDEPILHTLGTGELRIDEPIPPKADAPVAAAAPAPMPEAAPMPEKRLSLLEKLRLERQQAKAARAAQAAGEPK
jgi:hypothetical protein